MKSRKIQNDREEPQKSSKKCTISPGFRARFVHTLDAKNRLPLPALYREVIREHYKSKELYLTTYDKEKIMVFPMDQWLKIEKDWQEMALYDEEVENIIFVFSYYGQQVSMDNTGRIQIPKTYVDEMNLESKIAIIGEINFFFLMNHSKADQHAKDILNTKATRKKLKSIGIQLGKLKKPNMAQQLIDRVRHDE